MDTLKLLSRPVLEDTVSFHAILLVYYYAHFCYMNKDEETLPQGVVNKSVKAFPETDDEEAGNIDDEASGAAHQDEHMVCRYIAILLFYDFRNCLLTHLERRTKRQKIMR